MAISASARAKTICVMIGDVSYDYTLELMSGINDAAEREGVQLFYMTGKQRHVASADPDKEQQTVSRYNSIYDYSGLVGADATIISCGSLTGFESDAEYQRLLKRFEGSPCVVLQKDIDAGPGKSCVTIDNYHSFCACAEHLIEGHGCWKIALVSGPKRHPETAERERAYRDTLEKHGLAVDEGLIVYGDLCGFVDEQVAQLLSDHPGLDAIAFCNDEMAKAGYRVCARLGLKVGRDIAITGFDNSITGRALMPPLTTISQNTYRAGELALMQAIALAEGREAPPVRLETSLKIRNSCGCSRCGDLYASGAAGEPLAALLRNMRSDLLRFYAQDGQGYLTSLIESLMDRVEALSTADPAEPLDEAALDAWLTWFAGELKETGVSVAGRLYGYLLQIPDDFTQPGVKKLFRILLHIQGFLFSYELQEAAKQFESCRGQAWFVPEFIRDLVMLEDDEGVFRSVVEKLRGIGLDNLYICLLPEPQVLQPSCPNIAPERILLAAYLSGGDSQAYPRSRMPVVDKNHPLRNLPHLNGATQLISFSVFSGDTQYGILLCEANKEKARLLHVIGLQIGILINFLDLKGKERVIEQELERIRERIEIMNFLSEYDSLCNVFNRRGFIERAIRMNQENAGKRAFFAFMDLDHLKEINDNFGHASGDDAIRSACDILKKIVRSNDLIARLGGDEFVGMFVADNSDFQPMFRARLKDAFEEYNRTSGKPYVVEVSIGIADFTCRQGMEIGRILNEADRYLYQEKKHRRTSALK